MGQIYILLKLNFKRGRESSGNQVATMGNIQERLFQNPCWAFLWLKPTFWNIYFLATFPAPYIDPAIIDPHIISNNVLLGRVFLAATDYEGYSLTTERSLKGKYFLRGQRKHWRPIKRLHLAVVRENGNTQKTRPQQKRNNQKYQKKILIKHFYLSFIFPNTTFHQWKLFRSFEASISVRNHLHFTSI